MENNRRKFIKELLSIGAIYSISPKEIFSKTKINLKNNATADIVTIIAIAQLAIGAAKLFQGSSTSGISELQIKLLQNISSQLKVVQDGITSILNNLEEIRKDIDQIPDKVVETLKKMSLQGNINSFDEIMRTWNRYDDKDQFLLESKAEIIKLIDKIREHRDVLMLFDNYLNLPVISTALYMEYNLMHLIGEREERIKSAIETYYSYFLKILYGKKEENRPLSVEITSLTTKLNKQIADSKQYTGLFETKLRQYGEGNVALGYYKYSYQMLESDNAELIGLGLIEENHQLCKIDVFFDSRIPTNRVNGVAKDYIYERENIIRKFKWIENKDVNLLLYIDDERKRIIDQAKERETEINRHIRKLYSMSSCFYSGNRALNFCQHFDLS